MVSSQFPLRPGDVIASAYYVERTLGAGGTGVVLAATDVRNGAKVAVKCLRPEHATDVRVLRLFRHEARIASCVGGEHGVRILDEGVLDLADRKGVGSAGRSLGGAPRLPYFVMERLEGTDLSSLLDARRCLDPGDAANYIAQACAALAEAHALGIVHSDIKPGNLFLTWRPDGSPLIKVLDFGIATLMRPGAAADRNGPTSRKRLGTPGYMSPEQLTSPEDIDTRADIWSLGVTLYRLITGKAPFGAGASADPTHSILNDPAPPMSAVWAETPVGLDAVVQRCLEKRREDRLPSVTDLARGLEPFVACRAAAGAAPPAGATRAGEVTRSWGRSPCQWETPRLVGHEVTLTASATTVVEQSVGGDTRSHKGDARGSIRGSLEPT